VGAGTPAAGDIRTVEEAGSSSVAEEGSRPVAEAGNFVALADSSTRPVAEGEGSNTRLVEEDNPAGRCRLLVLR